MMMVAHNERAAMGPIEMTAVSRLHELTGILHDHDEDDAPEIRRGRKWPSGRLECVLRPRLNNEHGASKIENIIQITRSCWAAQRALV